MSAVGAAPVTVTVNAMEPTSSPTCTPLSALLSASVTLEATAMLNCGPPAVDCATVMSCA